MAGRLASMIANWLSPPPARPYNPLPQVPPPRIDDAGPNQPGFPTADSAGSPSGFEGGSLARRLSPWRGTRAHINTLLAGEGPLVRARHRQLIANAPYAASASDAFVAYATGTGITPSWKIDNPEQKAAVQKAFLRWTDEADADGLTDFYGLQSLAARALFDAGEVFIRLRPRYAADGLSVPLQLQLLEAEQLDTGFTMTAGLNVIRMGIEFNPIGQRVAYWFWRNHPGDMTVLAPQAERVRVPAEYVIHVFKMLRPGQIRGRPWLTASMIKLHDLDQYDDAELARKKGAAMFMAWLVRGLDADPAADIPVDAIQDAMDATGLADLTMEPSVIQELPRGVDVKFNQPADVGPNYEAFQFRTITQSLASTGMPYHSVTGDTSKANYSSLRAAQLETRRRIEQFQNETMIFQMCRPVGLAWLPAAVLSGAVNLPGFARNQADYSDCLWQTPRWDYVDPLKDVQAEKLEVDFGFRSRSSVIRSKGWEPEDVDKEIAEDHAREKRLGISFAVGFTKAPDKPAGQDTAPTGADTQEGGQPPADDQQQGAA